MTPQIDLIWLGGAVPPPWTPGNVFPCVATPRGVAAAIDTVLRQGRPGHVLLWDARLGAPAAARVCALTTTAGQVWHAGLRLGMAGRPGLLDFVAPVWMLNRDPDPASEATSWRLSLRACLIDTAVIRQLGGPRTDFDTLDGMALELGHRYIMLGAMMRYEPSLIGQNILSEVSNALEAPSLLDEMRFMRRRFSPFWNRWMLLRALITGYAPRSRMLRAWWQTRAIQRGPIMRPFQLREHTALDTAPKLPADARVTVLIPTIDRYAYLRTLLGQLRAQSVPPFEIVIVDQTEKARRDETIAANFADLPLKIIYLDKAGQCSARNTGLKASSGSYMLFIDDDDEIPTDLIEQHLASLCKFQVEVSAGTADEIGAGPLPYEYTYPRMSDVFPTNNALLQCDVLRRSGLFDLAYERMPRADGDLGMRIYLSGARMIYDPTIKVLHHHAPRGGLRVHKARVVTYASSRNQLWHRQLPSVSEVYLGLRYFGPRAVREMLWMAAFGTFAIRGGRARKTLKALIGFAILPDTIRRIRRSYRQARTMLAEYPKIDTL